MTKRVAGIIQARMSSRRLPGKVLLDIHGRPMLERVVERARRSGVLDTVIVATSVQTDDDPIAAHCAAVGIDCFRGDLDDVLDRYLQAAEQHTVDVLARITADCPLLDPAVLQRMVETYLGGEFDYVSNVVERTFPDGLDTEVLAVDVLRHVHEAATLPSEREHVTPFIYNNPERFRLAHVRHDSDLSHHRWTVDEPRDLDFVRAVYSHFGDQDFAMADVVTLLESQPELLQLNANIPTNEGYAKSLQEDGSSLDKTC